MDTHKPYPEDRPGIALPTDPRTGKTVLLGIDPRPSSRNDKRPFRMGYLNLHIGGVDLLDRVPFVEN